MPEQPDAHIFVIDRFEDNGFAVLERSDGVSFPIPADWLPAKVQEGDILRFHRFNATTTNSSIFLVERDDKLKSEKLETLTQLRAALPRGPEGDFSL